MAFSATYSSPVINLLAPDANENQPINPLINPTLVRMYVCDSSMYITVETAPTYVYMYITVETAPTYVYMYITVETQGTGKL